MLQDVCVHYPAKKEISQVITQPTAERPIHVTQSQRSHKEKYGFVIQFQQTFTFPRGVILYSWNSLDRIKLGSRYNKVLPKAYEPGLERLQVLNANKKLIMN